MGECLQRQVNASRRYERQPCIGPEQDLKTGAEPSLRQKSAILHDVHDYDTSREDTGGDEERLGWREERLLERTLVYDEAGGDGQGSEDEETDAEDQETVTYNIEGIEPE